MPISPLAPKGGFPAIPPVRGVRFAVARAGVRYRDRTDVMAAILDAGTAVSGVFTRSRTRSASVLDCEAKIGGDDDGPAVILVNSGNSNAFTGRAGAAAVDEIARAAAEAFGISPARVFTSSTGVIGEPLPHDRIIAVLDTLADTATAEGFEDAARAIMTTDTFPKGAVREVRLDGTTVHVAGFAKGSGMIAPDLATMLAYVFTDARIPPGRLQSMLADAVAGSFNAITVDSDTSTSDTVLAAATGAAGVDGDTPEIARALSEVCLDLAHQIVRDGEGASKFVTVRVTGAVDEADARKVAMAIANSPLVKTAVAGEDPNWGRVVMAVGKSGAEADRDRLTIRFGRTTVAEDGAVSPSYSETEAARYMKGDEIEIAVDLGLGEGRFTAWTCDLTDRYIAINADYRS